MICTNPQSPIGQFSPVGAVGAVCPVGPVCPVDMCPCLQLVEQHDMTVVINLLSFTRLFDKSIPTEVENTPLERGKYFLQITCFKSYFLNDQ